MFVVNAGVNITAMIFIFKSLKEVSPSHNNNIPALSVAHTVCPYRNPHYC